MENREIKFRGLYHQSVSNTIGWVYGNLILGTGPEGGKFAQIEHSDFHDYALYDVDPKTVGQYTGLKDADGVDVYDGDIVNRYSVMGQGKARPMVVVWNQDGCGWSLQDANGNMALSKLCKIKVIGNVHESPELLPPPAAQ